MGVQLYAITVWVCNCMSATAKSLSAARMETGFTHGVYYNQWQMFVQPGRTIRQNSASVLGGTYKIAQSLCTLHNIEITIIYEVNLNYVPHGMHLDLNKCKPPICMHTATIQSTTPYHGRQVSDRCQTGVRRSPQMRHAHCNDC